MWNVQAVGPEFKRERFLDLHVKAMRWPSNKIDYLGINPYYMREEAAEWDSKRTVAVKDGERRNGFKVWSGDMLGTGAVLREKRRERNPWLVSQVFFEDHERSRSGVASETVNHEDGLVEEVLKDELQPWEVSC